MGTYNPKFTLLENLKSEMLLPGATIIFDVGLTLDRWTIINAGAEYPSFIVVRNCYESETVNNLGFSEYNGQLLTSKDGFINADGNTVGAWRNKKVVVRDPSIKTTYLTSQHPKPKLIIL